jgi:hypothetical protein
MIDNDVRRTTPVMRVSRADSQYRRIANTSDGSLAGFLYLPNFHTVLNVLKEFFNSCYHVSIVFIGMPVDCRSIDVRNVLPLRV